MENEDLQPKVGNEEGIVAFMGLVDCKRSEVLDTAQRASSLAATVKGVSSQVMYFGKYEGFELAHIPSAYLRWALKVRSPSRAFRKFQRIAREELRSRFQDSGGIGIVDY